MSDADLNTQQLCDRLNALALSPGLDTLTFDETIVLWWEGWQVAARVGGSRRTSYVLSRDDVWVWLTVVAGAVPLDDENAATSAHWAGKDKHARAMTLFAALAETLVTDYSGIYLAVHAWAHSDVQNLPVMKYIDPEGDRHAGPAAAFLSQLDAADPGTDRSALDFMIALRGHPAAPFMPCATP